MEQQKITADRSKPFGWSDKIGYALGDAGNNFTFTMISSFFMIFLTNILGISPAIVAMLLLLARLIDAIADITVGRLVDVSKLKNGSRFIPWITRFKWPLAIFAVLLFIPYVNTLPMAARVAYVSVMYLGWGIIYSCVNIPYGSLSAAMSDDSHEKSTLSTWRTLGATAASMSLNFALPVLAYSVGPNGTKVLNETNFLFVVVGCVILSLVSYKLTTVMTTERIHVEREKALPLSELLKHMAGNRALIALVVLDLVLTLNQNLNGVNMTYLFTYYFGSVGALATILLLQSLLTFAVAPFSSWLTNTFGRKETTVVALIEATLFFWILVVLHTHSIAIFMTLNILANVGVVIFNINIWAFINDVIDNQQVITGIREVGSIYAVNSLSRKIAQAIAGSFGAGMFAVIGFVASTSGGAQQSTSTINGIYVLATMIPAVTTFVAVFVTAFWYPLNKKKVLENIKTLEENIETVEG
ncbi:MAG: MFS transporter [Streptococcaceae bacterium]|jgi:GPH family glycoside/pentoside/hexuronide:cation symporter|nr:MFS transporter [Streptococcaceae bacterium]